ncbi:hypothetical protein KK471_29120 [Klebsiella pneumoniae]|nr:hypothetical protein [Klebsiella pneumoniae]
MSEEMLSSITTTRNSFIYPHTSKSDIRFNLHRYM